MLKEITKEAENTSKFLLSIPHSENIKKQRFFDYNLCKITNNGQQFRIALEDRSVWDQFKTDASNKSISFNELTHSYNDYYNKTLDSARKAFEDAKVKYLSDKVPAGNHEAFMIAASRYHEVLMMLSEMHIRFINKLNSYWFKKPRQDQLQWLGTQVSEIQQYAKELSSQLEYVAAELLTSAASIDINLTLKENLTKLNQSYEKEYIHQYGQNTFWHWVKTLFRKSSRAEEIAFIQSISNTPDCSDKIRFESIWLLRNHILEKEAFGGHSRLGNLLDELLKLDNRNPETTPNEDFGTLKRFIQRHEALIEQIPNSLIAYFPESIEITHVCRFL